MAVIREQLVMEDRFTSALNSYVNLMENSDRTTKQTKAALSQLNAETRAYSYTLRATAAEARTAAAAPAWWRATSLSSPVRAWSPPSTRSWTP